VRLLYFAWVRQNLGKGEERYARPDGVNTLCDLVIHLAARDSVYAEVFGHPERLRAAINQTHAGFASPIAEGDEIAFFPPVTGG